MVKELFKVDPTEQQAMAMMAVAESKRCTVKSCHGSGKTTLASWLNWWFLLTRPYPKVICTAPSYDTLQDGLWAECAKWQRQSPVFSELFTWTKHKIHANWSSEEWFAVARSAGKGESIQGRRSKYTLLIIDEASGVDDDIEEAAGSLLTQENAYALYLSNPTKLNGFFYRLHTNPEAGRFWKRFTFSAYDSPLVSKSWIEEKKAIYGVKSNYFKVRVLGEFPYDEEDTLIPIEWVNLAVDSDIKVWEFEPVVLGVDVGAGGDRSVICPRKGSKVFPLITNEDKNTMNLIKLVGETANRYKADAICVDSIGIGKGVFDRMEELGYEVYSVDVRQSAREEGFSRLRDELYWKVRTDFESGMVSIPYDPEFMMELSSIKYDIQGNSIKVQSKKEVKKELSKRGSLYGSPDKLDSYMLTKFFDDAMYQPKEDMEVEERVRKSNRRSGY